MALSKIDIENMVTGELTTTNGGTGATSFAAGITEADIFRVTADFSGNANPISSNLERSDDASFGKLGTGVTNSSGTFSFATTGIYLVRFVAFLYTDNSADYVSININVTTNNSSYDLVSAGIAQMHPVDAFSQGQASAMIDVTDTSNVKVRFQVEQADTSNVIRGHTDYNRTWFEFIRLGDT
tara:strand:+ start:11 stop:559 length:549 start_codon:yes stop_codon:yes gene_type:complete